MGLNSILDFSNEEIIVSCGGKRNFKGVEAVRCICEAYKDGYEILTNIRLNCFFFKERYVLLNDKNPEILINEIRAIMDKRRNVFDYHKTLLVIDEASSVADSVLWKKNVSDSDIWKQLGKLGITLYVINQNFNMTYNRIRDNCDTLKITKRISADNDNYYLLSIFKQDVLDYKKYNPIILNLPIDARPFHNLYNTRQLLYLK